MFHPVKKILITETRHSLIKMAVTLEEKGGGLMHMEHEEARYGK